MIPVEWIINDGGEREREKKRERERKKREKKREEDDRNDLVDISMYMMLMDMLLIERKHKYDN